MQDKHVNHFKQLEDLVGKQKLKQKQFSLTIKCAPKRPISVVKTGSNLQITLEELNPHRDRVGSISYADLGVTQGADRLIVLFSITDKALVPTYAQVGELLPLYSNAPEAPQKLDIFAEVIFRELTYGDYGTTMKLGTGTRYKALANIDMKDRRINRDDVIDEKVYKSLNPHLQNKFVPIEINFSEKVPAKMLELGTALSTKVGWACKANISTADDKKYVRGELYSNEQYEQVPENKKHKFIRMSSAMPVEIEPSQ